MALMRMARPYTARHTAHAAVMKVGCLGDKGVLQNVDAEIPPIGRWH